MGNKVCCQDYREETNPLDKIQAVHIAAKQAQNQQPVKDIQKQVQSNEQVQEPIVSIQNSNGIPQLNLPVKETYNKHLFFQKEFESTSPIVHKFDDEVYEGEINKQNQKPHGLGKIYKNDGSVYIGYFNNGKAQGKGAFIFADGSYYLGNFQNNQANCQDGYYESDSIKYSGSFKQNAFEGKGKQIGDSYTFDGDFVKGRRVKGILKWKGNKGFDYQYNGGFNNDNQFHGNGVLIDQKGTYKGSFVNGQREGQGQYQGNNGVTYIGLYKSDQKDGFGTIYNEDKTISYRGQFKNGLPHGKGSCFRGKKEIQAEFFQGIDVRQLKNVTKQ